MTSTSASPQDYDEITPEMFDRRLSSRRSASSELVGSGRALELELGIGTGRIALPLALKT